MQHQIKNNQDICQGAEDESSQLNKFFSIMGSNNVCF